jgi:hypothetical protein
LKALIAIALLALAALVVAGCFLWNQKVTPIPKDSPLAIQCGNGGWCDRRTERCKPPTSDRPDGYCEFVGDDGRAFGSKRLDGGVE